ncbi:MAG: DUF4214 domain-containing protein [Pikeienuella sp.]
MDVAFVTFEVPEGFEGTLSAGTYTLWFNQNGAAQTATVELEIRDAALGDGLGQDAVETVVLLDEAGLDRADNLDSRGMNFWTDAREAGRSEAALAQALLASDAFAAAFGAPDTLSDEALVEQLHLKMLDRAAEAEGIAFWTARVATLGFSRADLLLAFAVSPEHRNGSTFTEAFAEIAPGEWAFV